jgi:hypothetical protein
LSSKKLALAVAFVLIAQIPQAWAAKSPGVRLKRVNQALESIAGRDKSARYLEGTAELAAGTLYTVTGVGLIYGVGKYMNQPNLPSSGLFSVELGSAFIDAYSRIPGVVLGVGVGGALTITGVSMGLEGYKLLFKRPRETESFFYGEWQAPPKTDKDVEKKADLGERTLKAWADKGRRDRLVAGWTNLACGGLILIAAAAHPEEPMGFFLGGGAGVYGFVSLLDTSQAEEEFLDYEAWRTDTPRETRLRGSGFKLAALPSPQAMALGFSYGF